MTGAANQGLPETFHYFDGKNMDFLMGEKAHFDFMKKKLKKGDFAEATRQIYKDLGYLMQDYKSLTAVTVSMLLKNGTQIFGQETSDIAIVGKRKAGELNLKTGEWEAFPDKEMNPYMSDYVEYQVLPYSVAQDYAKRAAAEDLKNGTAGQVKFFYDVFLIGPTSWKGTKLAQNKNLLKNVAYRVKHIFPTVEQQESAKQINDLLEQLKKAAEEAQKNAG